MIASPPTFGLVLYGIINEYSLKALPSLKGGRENKGFIKIFLQPKIGPT
jgi:hypothetical protein